MLAVCSVFLVALASCQRSEVYMEYRPVNTLAWGNNDKLEFDISPVPEDGKYILSLELRTTESNNYPYKDLYIEVRQLWSREEDVQLDSIQHVNDSLCLLHRTDIAELERFIKIYEDRIGVDRDTLDVDDKDDEQTDDGDYDKDDDSDDGVKGNDKERNAKEKKKKDRKSKKKKSSKKDKKSKNEDGERRHLSPRDSLIALNDSLSRSLVQLRQELNRMENVNDSIDEERARRIYADTVHFCFTDDNLRPTGVTVRQYSMPIKTIYLEQGQHAHIIVRHIMRLEALPGISDVGLTLERE